MSKLLSQEQKSIGIWVRVSTEDQVRGESPEHHEKRARAYAEARGWHVAALYRLDAVSGKSVLDHPEAKRMLNDVKAGTITGLVFSKLARLARNTRELLEFSDLFRSMGADLISLQEAIDTSSPSGRLFFTMIAAMCQWEREEIVDRVRASVPIRAKMGKSLGGAASFGYQWKDKKLVPNPKEAPVRVLLHELFVEHKRKRTVARILNERGYRTRSGSEFTYTTVKNLLQDPTPKGLHRANYTQTNDRNKSWKLKPESDWVYTNVEPIMSEELWDECDRILKAQKSQFKQPAKKVTYLFSGFAHCSCGSKMYVRSNRPKYVCENCRNNLPIEDLEAVYKEQLSHFLISPTEIEAHNVAASESLKDKQSLVETLQAELKRIELEDEKLFQLFVSQLLTKDEFGKRHKPLSDRRLQLEDELPRLQAECDILLINSYARQEALGEARNLTNRWQELPEDEKRQIIEAITDRIIIGRDDIEIRLIQLPELGIPNQKATRPHGFIAAIN